MKEKIVKLFNDINPEIVLYNGDNLFEAGLLDSLQIMKLIVLLENEFNVEIDIQYINADNFKNVNSIINVMNQIMNC